MRLSIKCPNCRQHFHKNQNVLDRRELERKWEGKLLVCPHCLRKQTIHPNEVRAVSRKWIGIIAFGIGFGGVVAGGLFIYTFYPITKDLELVGDMLKLMIIPMVIAMLIQRQEEQRASLFNRYRI
jgi:hypothetical protein